jgi:hypothetical protein
MQPLNAGEDTPLELEEVIFRGNKLRFAREEGRASMKIAEVMVFVPTGRTA